jgi:hypothetical protein
MWNVLGGIGKDMINQKMTQQYLDQMTPSAATKNNASGAGTTTADATGATTTSTTTPTADQGTEVIGGNFLPYESQQSVKPDASNWWGALPGFLHLAYGGLIPMFYKPKKRR